jgi:hypothetical protein
VLDVGRIEGRALEQEPYAWAFVDRLFAASDAEALAASFPRDHFKKVAGYDGEKGYSYLSRSLVHMGAGTPSHPEGLSPAWRLLAADLLSPAYRRALAELTGRELAGAAMEINVIRYGPGAWLGPHLDLKEKLATHILYFNEEWRSEDGGCLRILRSADPSDVATEVLPVVGNSAVLVRSERSWHAVSRVQDGCTRSRRSVNVIFHLPGSVSTMWPPGDEPSLLPYDGDD